MQNAIKNFSLKTQIEAFEQDLIEGALIQFKGNISKAARFLQIERTALVMKMKKYDTKKNLAAYIVWQEKVIL